MAKPKPKRSKALTILLFPLLMCIFVIGFFMYSVGDRKKPNRKQEKAREKDDVTLMPIVHEEEEIIYT